MVTMLRWVMLLVIVMTAFAVGLSWLSPPASSWRLGHHADWTNVPRCQALGEAHTSTWLDLRSGRFSTLTLPRGEVLDVASGSPWIDEDGRMQVVGRWTRWSAETPFGLVSEIGIARCTFPDGEVLDRVESEVVPSGAPCWYPGMTSRVLFSAADGKLYHFSFEGDRSRRGESEAADEQGRKPRRLRWRCETLAEEDAFISDPCWPDDPELGGRLVVAIRTRIVGGNGTFTPTRLWWLKLDETGTEVVAAAPLIVPDVPTSLEGEFNERLPAVATVKGKGLALAYLSRRSRDVHWRLRIVPIEFDRTRQVPVAFESSSRAVADDCLPIAPAFSADGRFLSAHVRHADRARQILRLRTDSPALAVRAGGARKWSVLRTSSRRPSRAAASPRVASTRKPKPASRPVR